MARFHCREKSAKIRIRRNNNPIFFECLGKNPLVFCRLHAKLADVYRIVTGGFEQRRESRRQGVVN